MNHEAILVAWVDYVCDDWLDKLNYGKPPQFHSSVEPLIRKLREKVSEKKFVEAWHCIEQVEKLYEHVSHEGKISPRMLLECGIASFRMGHPRDAIPFLKGAGTSYFLDHDKAIARWLLGCVYWYIGDSISALSSWEDACRYFKEQALKTGRGSDLSLWYAEKINEIENAIRFASDKEAPAFPVPSTKRKTDTKKHTLRTLPVIGQIPAGTPLNILPATADFIKMEHVCIDDKDHCVVSLLRGEKIVNLPQRGQFYYLLRISGNSMNRCLTEPIENGDYVILREQHTADSGDIVAAMIVKGGGEDNQATLKRYVMRDGKIFLQPESDDHEFQNPVYSQSFTKPNDEFQIRGVAIAVLKPL